jgi:putative redox protein
MSPNSGSPPTVVTHLNGERFAIRIRSHEIIVDQTLAGGGSDSAPTPIELLGASLGSCIAYYVHHFYHTRGLSTEGLRVEVSQRSATNPNRVSDFTVKLVLPSDMPLKYMPLLDRVIQGCPAHNTLMEGARIEVEIEAPQSELASV